MSIEDKKQGGKGAYEVGYGKPPVVSRFKKGQSGNPRGRAKGSKNKLPPFGNQEMMSMILKEAYRRIKITENGRQIDIPVIQGVLRSTALAALNGKVSAQKLLTASALRLRRLPNAKI